MDIEFLTSGPGVVIEDESRVLYVADIHMGIEADLRSHGVHIRSKGKERVKRLLNCVKEAQADMLVILGDVKHRIPGTSWQELSELPSLFRALREIIPFYISPGNHDPGIEEFLKPDEFLNINGTIFDRIGVLHGHTRPHKNLAGKLILCGHHHPTVTLSDEVGVALRSPCYILGELEPELFEDQSEESGNTRVLMIPSFNELTGYGVDRIFRSPFSPISRALITSTAECLLPDGTYAGDLKTLIGYDDARNP